MKLRLLSLCILALCVHAVAQDSNPRLSSGRAAIAGVVTRDPTSEPVKKALVELIAENQKEGGDYTAETGADGAFRIENILPGRYRLFAERSGFLDVDKHHGRSEGHVLVLAAGQEVKDLQIRLQAAAVLHGRVTDEDGDALPSAEVTVWRQTFVSGHKRWEQAGSERTNDLGEYRIANLPSGNVYVSVAPPPDFKRLIESGGTAVEARNAAANEKGPATAYQTTYYPGTSDRGQASPIQLHPGDEFPVNFSLTPSPSFSVRGQVVNLPPRTTATIMLQSRDSRTFTSVGTEMHKDGSFLIRDVSPGSYTIMASVEGSPVPMTAQQSFEVGANSVDGLRLAPQPGAVIRGQLRLDGGGNLSRFGREGLYLVLQAAGSEESDAMFQAGTKFSNLAHVGPDGAFEWADVPPGNYYVRIMGDSGTNADWFLKTVLAGGHDVNDSGISVSGGMVVLDVVVSANGGAVDGMVADAKGEPVSNAVVVAVPEARMRGREDRYRQTVSDQSGHFTLRGIPGGGYNLFAWERVDGQAYYNPEFLKDYEGQGTALQLSEGDRKALQLRAITAPEDQP